MTWNAAFSITAFKQWSNELYQDKMVLQQTDNCFILNLQENQYLQIVKPSSRAAQK